MTNFERVTECFTLAAEDGYAEYLIQLVSDVREALEEEGITCTMRYSAKEFLLVLTDRESQESFMIVGEGIEDDEEEDEGEDDFFN